MKFFLPLLLGALAPCTSAQPVISVHGSGTTNPQKCYWDIMDTLMKQSKQPIRFTYRGVGSSTGQAEFMGDGTYQPFNDFGSGDIPLSQEKFDEITGAGVEILHLPVMMGAIGFFHSVPTDGKDLNLTPCVLAKILNRDITDWTDQEIISLNPNLNLPSPFPINVARRVKGSSSTASITNYLHQVCPEQWDNSLVGKVIPWKQGTLECEGSGGMTDCIRGQPGTIGYIDAGHGHAEELSEIDLKNADGEYLNSKKAAIRNGILAAAEATSSGVPDALDQTFANVNLLNQAGGATWPIVAMTYIYIRKDITYLAPESQHLLKGFLNAVYKEQYTDICKNEFGFVPVTGDLRDKALEAINNLVVTAGGNDWYFEESTEPATGQDENVFSIKRNSFSEIEQDSLVRQIKALQAQLDDLKSNTKSNTDTHEHMDHSPVTVADDDSSEDAELFYSEFDRDDELTAALAMGAVSIVLWIITILCFLVKYVMRV